MYSWGMRNGTNGSIASGIAPQTIKGNLKAHTSSFGREYRTPPTTGPSMQPTVHTVLTDAITAPELF